MDTRTAMMGTMMGSLVLMTACVDSPEDLGQHQDMISTNAQAGLTWANGWISDAIAHPELVAENVYTTVNPALARMITDVMPPVKAINRTVCGTFVTRLYQNSVGYVPNDFYNSFNRAMTDCKVGTVDSVQQGTNSPDAAQYQWKIANCALTGPIKFTVRTTIGAIEAGDVLAVKYTDPAQHKNATGHVMIVRSAPVADASLTGAPAGSTGYTVDVIDSTSSPHDTGPTSPPHAPTDWRGLDAGQGLGHGTFVLYADASGTLVASRWSPTDPTVNSTSVHPLAVGGLQ